jgi:transposase
MCLFTFSTPHKTPHALQKRIPILFYEQSRTVKEISDILGIGLSTVYRVLQNYKSYGTPHNLLAEPQGRKPLLDNEHLGFICRAVRENPVIYQDKIQLLLHLEYGFSVSIPTISCALSKLKITHVRVARAAAERNATLRLGFKDYARRIIQYPDQALFLDESAKDQQTFECRFGWTEQGARCEVLFPFIRGQRYSLLAALGASGIVASEVYEGAVNAERFYVFMQDFIVSSHLIPTGLGCLIIFCRFQKGPHTLVHIL